MRETHDGDVNLATIYEVERLLNMLRPYYLNPDLQWAELFPVCQKFMAEKGTIDIKD
jgi:non-homologous end joining protein Ku